MSSDGGDAKRIEIDAPRLLAQRSEYGHVDDRRLALRDEPEAVSEQAQAEITLRADRERQASRQRAWAET